MENKSFIDSLTPKSAFLTGVVVTILVLGTVGFIVLGSCLLSGKCSAGSSTTSATQAAAAPAAAAPTATAPAAANGPIPAVTSADQIRGDANAPVTIVEYSDYQCPFCQAFYPTMQQVMTDYPHQVRWVYRQFPLSFHPNAEQASIDAMCAANQGKFWEFSDAMFAGQTANLEGDAATAQAFETKTAQSLGLNMTTYTNCSKDPKTQAIVDAEEAGGQAAGVDGTPGSFIIAPDGSVQSVLGAQPYASVKPMIDAALAKAAK